jgi:hypothetical protein
MLYVYEYNTYLKIFCIDPVYGLLILKGTSLLASSVSDC